MSISNYDFSLPSTMIAAMSHPLLTADEEMECGRVGQQRDEAKVQRLILANTRLAYVIAKRHRRTGVTLVDAFGAGIDGLIKAARRYDSSKGRFSTYAAWYIRDALFAYYNRNKQACRFPSRMGDLEATLINKLGADKARELSAEDLAERHGLTLKRARMLVAYMTPTVSLDAPVASDSAAQYGDFIADERAATPAAFCVDADTRELVQEVIKELTPREQTVLRGRYGFDGDEQTLEDLSKVLRVTRERVRQIQEKAERRLRFLVKQRGMAPNRIAA